MTMMRKEAAGEYQIGIWCVCREGRKWTATASGALGESRLSYSNLSAAYLALTGEPLNANKQH